MKPRFLACTAFACIALAHASFAQGSQLQPDPKSSAAADPTALSGEYEFLHQGEILQLTIQPDDSSADKKITGFVSRHGELESDRGTPLDHFITNGVLHGDQLQFRTGTIHGVWFEFKGSIKRGPGHSPGERGYFMLEGKLTEHVVDRDRHETAQSREVTFHSMPAEASQ
jgi:hypothetical protein